MMNEKPRFDEESSAVQAHLSIMQGVIGRMAGNSASCKTWCITLVAAVLVVVARGGDPDYSLIALVPAILFLFLDTYYLALERRFRQSYNDFISKLHNGRVESSDLYAVFPSGPAAGTLAACLRSTAIWPFYLTLAVMTVLVWQFILA